MSTIPMSPQLQIYNEVFKAALTLDYNVYDYLPSSSTSMPFVYIGEQSDQDQHTKDLIYGFVQQSIYFYHDYKKRRELTTMMDQLKMKLRQLKRTDNFYIECRNINAQTRIDDSTGTAMLQGIIEVEFKFH